MLVQGYDGVEIGRSLGVTKGAISQRKARIAAAVSDYLTC